MHGQTEQWEKCWFGCVSNMKEYPRKNQSLKTLRESYGDIFLCFHIVRQAGDDGTVTFYGKRKTVLNKDCPHILS